MIRARGVFASSDSFRFGFGYAVCEYTRGTRTACMTALGRREYSVVVIAAASSMTRYGMGIG